MKSHGTQSSGTHGTTELPKVRVDRNGGLHVSGEDMAASGAFQRRLEKAAKMKIGPPPTTQSGSTND